MIRKLTESPFLGGQEYHGSEEKEDIISEICNEIIWHTGFLNGGGEVTITPSKFRKLEQVLSLLKQVTDKR
jgi:hypothetical protein